MKSLLLSLIFALIILMDAKAQFVIIPDSNFAAFLSANFPFCMNGNQMDISCADITTANTLNCGNQNISDLTGIEYFTSLQELLCHSNNLTSLQSLPASLTYLTCAFNPLNNLSVPPNLQQLGCSFTNLSALPSLPSSLTFLDCSYNSNLTFLPSLPGTLEELRFRDCSISSLPILPSSLIFLDCSENPLLGLPSLPSFIEHINCENSTLTSLPVLPASVLHLNANFNAITSLPSLPNGLEHLEISGNQLTSLPSLPPSLMSLICSDNNIGSLPSLPPTLMDLECMNCGLSHTPYVSPSMMNFNCSNNILLASLTNLPDSAYMIDISNTSVSCLPPITTANIFIWANTGITCLPNLFNPAPVTSFPNSDTLPVCDLFNANGCEFTWNISGQVYADSIINCAYDVSESPLANVKVLLYKNGQLHQQTLTNSNGYFSFDVDSGVYDFTIDTAAIPAIITCPANGFYSSVISPADSMDALMDFAMQCKPGFDLAVQTVAATDVFRPGGLVTVTVPAGDRGQNFNLECASGVSGTVTVIMSGPVTFVSPAPGALVPVIVGNTMTYPIADFASLNFNTDFTFVVSTDTLAQIGDQVCFDVTVNPIAGDNNPLNNTLTHCFSIVNSFDPNDKQSYPNGYMDPSEEEWITYTIRFQNTGNAPAQHIYIADTLDANLDESTFQLLAYSHEPLVQIIGKKMLFNFPNINLPDSVNNEPGSHGYVQYKVKLNDNAPLGATISNTAYIYFDFNPPVITNTTTTLLVMINVEETVGSDLLFYLYPNPAIAGNEIKFSISDEVKAGKLKICDNNGRVLFTEEIHDRSIQPLLKAGLYQCILDHAEGRLMRKLIILQ